MHCHCGTNNRAPRWTFTAPCKPEVRPGAREESASPAWLAAPAMRIAKWMFTKLGRDEVLMARPYLPSGRSSVRQNRSWGEGGHLLRKAFSSDRKATATNRIHSIDLEACDCYEVLLFLVPFCSQIFYPSALNLAYNRSAHCAQVSDQCPLGL